MCKSNQNQLRFKAVSEAFGAAKEVKVGGLENTYINVFVYKSEVVGVRLETMDVGVKENEIYEFANNTYGNLSQDIKNKNWFGYKDISVGQDKILYAKKKDFNGTIETLDISTQELIDFTIGESVILAVN